MEDRVKKPSAYEGMVAALQKRNVLRDPDVFDKLNVQRIQGQELNAVFVDESSHISDALKCDQAAARLYRMPPVDPITRFKDHELIMELLKRGYAAMKLPADGGPPEVLR